MRKLYLTKTASVWIFIYYSLLFFFSLFLVIRYFYINLVVDKDVYIYSSLAGLLGSSIYYIRKLYKDCFNDEKITLENDFLKQLATIVYYLTRPFFAVAFSIFIILGLKAGFIIIASSQNEINPKNFIYVCLFVSFVTGFNVGRLISKFENFEIIK